jgi:membrane protein
MPLSHRNRSRARDVSDDYSAERPLPDEAPEPQPEHAEPKLDEPRLRDLSKRDFVAIAVRAFKEFRNDHMTNIAAALAYYAFLAIPAALLIAVGVFGLVASPSGVSTVVDKLHGVVPDEARSLLEGSLTNLTQRQGTGIAVLIVGGALALWSLTGAMQNLMWALNIAYDQEEGRGFVRRRMIGLVMLAFALLGFALAFGVLVLGPQLSTWIGNALGVETLVKVTWYAAEWPLLVCGLLLAFAGLMYLGPNVEHPRWSFLSLGAVLALLVWLAASAAFAFYVSRFGSYNKAWGSLAAVVVMLTWLWLSAAALLFGAEVNAEAERSRELRRGEPAEVELQVPAKA